MDDRINTLDELLSDPMVQLVMQRDRVRPEQVRVLLERVRGRVAGEAPAIGPQLPPAHMVARTCQKLWLCR
ncbi:hypothetical protein [Mesorhizobium helmanticense]|uniref:Uncharacterized protein n=1 Tax=Mesorhizobium helmanticense TaxID=1776423 RepID=A0A2T4J360_9HYPH|nr:hypothetical protein [Mesorhizobium helmanticense]PTE12346.1 hypothetical protein C9427_01820 [Mesorhizobium helmanticense]